MEEEELKTLEDLPFDRIIKTSLKQIGVGHIKKFRTKPEQENLVAWLMWFFCITTNDLNRF